MSKNARSGKQKDYFGSIACAICAGPVDELLAIIIDSHLAWPLCVPWEKDKVFTPADFVLYGGRAWVWMGNDNAPANVIPGTSSWVLYSVKRVVGGIETSNPAKLTITNYGSVDFYWGLSNQTLITDVADKNGKPHPRTEFANLHPPYRNQCFALFWNFKFGRERVETPNVQFVTRRTPHAPILTPEMLALDPDGQANPIAIELELITSPIFGAGISPTRISPDVTAEATALKNAKDDRGNANGMQKYYLSVAESSGSTVRRIIGETIAYRDGWWKFDDQGRFVTGRFPTGVPVFDTTNTVDDTVAIDEMDLQEHDWAEASTEVVVEYTSALLAYKKDARKAVSGYARQVIGEPRSKTLERPYITRESQAAQYAAEYLRSYTEPYFSGSVVLRPHRSQGIKPGTIFRLDHDQMQISLACRCLSRQVANPPASAVTILFESDRLLGPLPYQAGPSPKPDVFPTPAEVIVLHALLQAPPELFFGAPYRVIVLAARRDPLTVLLRVWLLVKDEEHYYELGDQTNFAVYGKLAADYSAVEPPDDTNGPIVPPDDNSGKLALTLDQFTLTSDLGKVQVPQTADAIDDNAMLLFVFDATDETRFEMMTVREMTLVGIVYQMKVRRARYGTLRGDWKSNDRAFIIPRKDLVPYTHAAIELYSQRNDTALFRLQAANTSAAENDFTALPDIPLVFFDSFAPIAQWAWFKRYDTASKTWVPADLVQSFKPDTQFMFRAESTDPTGDLTMLQVLAQFGGQEITLYTKTMQPTSGYSVEVPFTPNITNMGEGNWFLVINVRDASGRVREYPLGNFLRLANNPVTVVLPPTISPPPGRSHTESRPVITLTPGSISASTIFYQITVTQASNEPINWAPYTGPFTLRMGTGYNSGIRVWTFATDGGSPPIRSPVVNFAYWYEP